METNEGEFRNNSSSPNGEIILFVVQGLCHQNSNHHKFILLQHFDDLTWKINASSWILKLTMTKWLTKLEDWCLGDNALWNLIWTFRCHDFNSSSDKVGRAGLSLNSIRGSLGFFFNSNALHVIVSDAFIKPVNTMAIHSPIQTSRLIKAVLYEYKNTDLRAEDRRCTSWLHL